MAAALAEPSHAVSLIRVVSNHIATLFETTWKCACQPPHSLAAVTQPPDNDDDDEESGAAPQEAVQVREDPCRHDRLQLMDCNLTQDSADQHLDAMLETGVDAIIACLGNRQPFHNDCIAGLGMQRLVEAMQRFGQRWAAGSSGDHRPSSPLPPPPPRVLLLSSAGIGDDWPPMEWSRSGERLQAFFRTICWNQFQDLSTAERAVREYALQNPQFDYLIARSVLLGEQTRPTGQWYIQQVKYGDHPTEEIAKRDAAQFLLQEALSPTIHQRAIVIGGMPKETHSAAHDPSDAI